jgi:K+/H+ antiporter YhaU regulatory subunit KhtT
MKSSEHISRYEEIAYLIAKRIVSGNIKENDKLKGRSLISSEYNVSSETVRKAMQLLSNYNVVTVKERSGIYVLSNTHAKAYIKHFEHQRSNKNAVQEAAKLLEQSAKINQQLEKKFKQIVSIYEKDVFPFPYFIYEIHDDSPFVNKTIESLNFYDQTGGMIIAAEYQNILTQIPSPETKLKAQMTLYILGDKTIKDKTFHFFNE